MLDFENKHWTRYDTECICEDGKRMYIVPYMTDEYLLSVIRQTYGPQAPEAVDMAPARLALLEAGLLSTVEYAINSLPEPERSAAKIEWEFRPRVRRDSSLVQQLGAALGLTDEQLDALFVRAQELT